MYQTRSFKAEAHQRMRHTSLQDSWELHSYNNVNKLHYIINNQYTHG